MEDKYSVESAEALANEALRLPISEAVPVYEQLLATFPTAAKYWKQYVEAHMAVNNDDATKQIFSRCLLNCLQIPLWRCYINFIRKANEKKGLEGQEETRKAFDFMLGYVGSDIASGPVWTEYINFLKSLPAQTAQEESQRMIAVRKVYQKAIVTPTHHVEQHWRDYENFENSVSRALAKGLLSEYQPKYNSARAVYRERKKYVDEIDWNLLALPPSGSLKAITCVLSLLLILFMCTEELQWMAWKRFLAFEKENPQRIDTSSANKRISFTYEQCLMYLYHYPDIWHDYATWHAKSGSIDSAIKVYQRSLKALPDCALLRYAYAELEESRGAIQAAKKVYESLLGDGANATALSHIQQLYVNVQFIRFLRRTEGVEAARKYFLDARKSPNCTYHVYVAYATMAFCMDKDAKIAHNVFEAGLKRYADFLSRLNDDRNIRALFERALSSLPPEESVEVWKRFSQFEQTYGDLVSMLKVEQRRKEALARTGEEGASALQNSLQDVVSRYSFMDLWPCSSRELDHLSHKSPGQMSNSNISSKIIYPDTSRMVVYDPRQKPVPPAPNAVPKPLPPALAAFIASLPAAEGPLPDVDYVLSICLQSTIPIGEPGKLAIQSQAGPASSDVSGSSKSHLFKPRDRQHGKRKDADRQDDDDSSTVQSQPLPKDAFKIRQLRKARVGGAPTGAAAASYGSVQTASASYGSGFSGEQSGSFG
ncbi:RNA-processing protein, HAT helix [Cynara cardunculus var. scolymus]|uniref:RNA-processing protein, HAT helix n=1 Tax=Cynara cardunculus var. scolymus TaxID=59895 RepID=A0A103Y3S6_CYNCS|nr:RNA-processing protein, HAT helix [Cynara cardunculus var. scolymus]